MRPRDRGRARQVALQLARQRQIEAVHRLGPRVIGELPDEIARHRDLHDDIGQRLDRYARLNAGILRELGADRFPQRPLWAMRGRP